MRIPLWVMQTVAGKQAPFTADFATGNGNVIRVRIHKVTDAETVCDFELNPGESPDVPGLLRNLEAQVEQMESDARIKDD